MDLKIQNIYGTINKTDYLVATSIEIDKMSTYSNVEGFIPSWIHIIVYDLSLRNSHSKNIIINCRRGIVIKSKNSYFDPCV